MADNVAITAGTGTTVATDDVSGAHYQKVKVGIGVADSAVMIGHAEDAAHASGDGGVLALAVRSDTAAQTAGTDGDYCALVCDSTGKLHVNVGNTVTVGSHAVTNAGTFVVQIDGAALTALQLIDDVVFAEDVASQAADKGIQVLTVRKDTAAATSGTDGDYQPPITDANGKLWVNAGGVTLTVASHDVTNAGTFAVQVSSIAAGNNNIGDVDVASIAAGDNNIGNVDIVTVPTDPFGANADAASATGSISAKLRFIASTGIPITGTVTVGSHAVTNAGTFAVQAACAGDVAHDAADSGNPVKVGTRVETSPSGNAVLTDADRADALSDSDGLLLVKVGGAGADFISEAVSNTDGASTAFTNFGAVANVKYAIHAISAFRTDSGTSMAYVDIRDGTAGSVLWRIPLPPAGGAIFPAGPVPYFKSTANTALAFDVSSALTTVYINISGTKTRV